MLDTTDPNRPRARTLDAALARIVRGRAVNPRFIEGQMRHGARGAAELAETVDRLVDFAETTGAVSSALFDCVHDAYLADPRVREFLLRENPAAARVIAERLEAARRKGLWHPRRNDLGEGLSRHPSGGGAMSKAFARGACPGLSAPMQTGDGLLARLVLAGPIPLEAFIGLCEAARAHGNGIMEISARGSLQIRGLNAVSAPLFAAAVEALGIDLCESVPVLSDPLPDDPTALIDSQAIAAALRQAIADAALALAPKVSVVIDGGGRIGLDALPADIRLQAAETSEGPRFHVALAGDASTATEVGVIAPQDAVDAVLALLSTIAASGIEARAADLLPPRDAAAPANQAEPRAAGDRAASAQGRRVRSSALGLPSAMPRPAP